MIKLNKEAVCLIMHLWYEETSISLIEKISQVWDGEVHVSLIKDAPNNECILKNLHRYFKEVHVYELEENFGNDQVGFINTFRQIKKWQPWVFYVHDKHPSKRIWLDDLVDPIIENPELINDLINKEEVGIISSKKMKMKVSYHDLKDTVMQDYLFVFQDAAYINISILKKFTSMWIKSLIEIFNILENKNKNLTKEKEFDFSFTAGNIFAIRSEIVYRTHRCVHQEYWNKSYQKDGTVFHGLERFYYYASERLGKQNKFI